MIKRDDDAIKILREILYKEKYKFADRNLICEVVEDSVKILKEVKP